MKNILKTMLALAFVSALMSAAPAEAQVTPTSYTALTGIPASVAGGATSNLTSTAIDVRQGKGMAVFAYFAGTNASATSALTLTFGTSYDGTNYSTTGGGLTLAPVANGTTAVRAYTNFPPDLLNNVQKVKLLSLANANDATNTLFITNIVVSFGN